MRVWTVPIVAWAFAGCATNEPRDHERERAPVASAAQAIQGGQLDITHRYVVGICRGPKPGDCTTLCSGTLILPNVVATARHCVSVAPDTVDCTTSDPSFGARKAGPIFVTTGANAMAEPPANPDWYSVTTVSLPTDDHVCGNDIALLVLNKSVPASEAKPAVPGIQHRMWDRSRYRASFTAIGYGATSPSGNEAGRRRARTSVEVFCVPDSNDDPCPAFIDPKEFLGGSATCIGDSGSGAFETASFGTDAPVSFGVLSRGNTSEDGKSCVGSAYTRFDAHRDFVLAAVKAASNDWQLYPEPSWTAFVPPIQPDPKPVITPPDAGPPAKAGFAAECAAAQDCSSNLCHDDGQGLFMCSQSCTATPECPTNFECRENLCLPPLPTKPAAKNESGCSVPASSAEAPFALAMLTLAVLRRRRR